MKYKNGGKMRDKIYVFLFVLASAILSVWFFYDIRDNMEENYINAHIEELQDTYRASFLSFENTTKAIMESKIDRPEVLSVFARGDDKAREELNHILTPTYQSLKNIGLKQLHFHTVRGESFLRMHTPKSYGDPLADIRPAIKEVMTKKTYVSGFEEGRIFNGFRYIYPLYYNAKYIGSVETSVSGNAIMEQMNNIKSDSYKLYLKKEVVESTVWKENVKSFYRNSTLSNNLMVETNQPEDRVIEMINKSMFNAEELKTDKPFMKFISIKESMYAVTFLPIKNIKGKEVAYLVRYSLDPTLWHIKQIFYIKVLVISLFLLVFSLLIYKLILQINVSEKSKKALIELNNSLEEKVDEKLKELREKDIILLKQSKNAIMGEMIAIIAHQWKQPLNTLGIYVQDLQDAFEFNEFDVEYLNNFTKQSMSQINYMAKTIDDFRDFLKPTQYKEDFYVGDTVKDSLELVKLDSSIINLQIIGEDFIVNGNASELKQVIITLISNAKDAIYSKKDLNQFIRIEFKNSDDNINHIIISDSAGGIDSESIAKVFEPYFTTKGEKGTGIGLYMAKMIIETHFNGMIKVENNNFGAVFTIDLPSVNKC
jgi:signal transduction histidine kinase